MAIPNFSMQGKVVVITGARRGMGKAFSLAFAEAGAEVVVCDKIVEDGALKVVANDIQKYGRRSLSVKVDTSIKAEVGDMVSKVIDEFGHIDVLVNSAAVIIRKPLVELEEDEWDTVVDVDLKGPFLCSQAVAKRMIEHRNMASRGAFKPNKNTGAYDIAKAGVVMLTRMLAVELASYNIRVNAIAPGPVKTEFNESVWSDPERLQASEARIPLGRWGEPKDIAGSVLFLASGDASGYITGHTILADGGIMA